MAGGGGRYGERLGRHGGDSAFAENALGATQAFAMNALPTLLIPGLAASPRLYQHQIPALWRLGPVTVADHTRQSSMSGLAQDILAAAPPKFALIGLSMGGYIAFEIVRQAPERVLKLVLLDTSARPDTPEQMEGRRLRIGMAQAGEFGAIPALMFPGLVHPARKDDSALKAIVEEMALETGAEAFIRQQTAIMGRPDSRPTLPSLECPALVLVGDSDQLTPPPLAEEIAQGIAGARLAVVPESGHLSTLERPEFVTREIAAWLSQI
jgi:pimeloyl-ACP methyl ester carboxylesterase